MLNRPSPSTDTWTDERIEQLKKLHHDGLISREIGAIMGLSRNAVIGKIDRMKLNRAGTKAGAVQQGRIGGRIGFQKTVAPKLKAAAVEVGPRTSHRNKNSTNGASIKHRIETRRDVYAEMDADVGIDVTHLLGRGACDATMKLTVHTCKWPVGDPMHPAFGYCGQPPIEGKPYCETHARRAYVQVG